MSFTFLKQLIIFNNIVNFIQDVTFWCIYFTKENVLCMMIHILMFVSRCYNLQQYLTESTFNFCPHLNLSWSRRKFCERDDNCLYAMYLSMYIRFITEKNMINSWQCSWEENWRLLKQNCKSHLMGNKGFHLSVIGPRTLQKVVHF